MWTESAGITMRTGDPQVDSPFDRPTPPAGIPLTPHPREPRHDGEPAGRDALLGVVDVQLFRGRWRELQRDFVDDPEQAVRRADQLVGEVMDALYASLAEDRSAIEDEWHRGGETEELRTTLRRYRAFFERLVNT